jgi:hypothetical protein
LSAWETHLKSPLSLENRERWWAKLNHGVHSPPPKKKNLEINFSKNIPWFCLQAKDRLRKFLCSLDSLSRGKFKKSFDIAPTAFQFVYIHSLNWTSQFLCSTIIKKLWPGRFFKDSLL